MVQLTFFVLIFEKNKNRSFVTYHSIILDTIDMENIIQ